METIAINTKLTPIQYCEYKWNSLTERSRISEIMLNGLSYVLLRLTDKKWNELPDYEQKVLYKHFMGIR